MQLWYYLDENGRKRGPFTGTIISHLAFKTPADICSNTVICRFKDGVTTFGNFKDFADCLAKADGVCLWYNENSYSEEYTEYFGLELPDFICEAENMTQSDWDMLENQTENFRLALIGRIPESVLIRAMRILPRLYGIDILKNSSTDGDGLEQLRFFDQLKYLSFICCKNFTDQGFEIFKDFYNLEMLSIVSCPKVLGNGFRHLKKCSLIQLDVIDSGITDEGMTSLKDLSSLEALNLAINPGITGSFFKALSDSVQCSEICLSQCSLSDEGIAGLRDQKKLECLNLARNHDFTEQGLVPLKDLPRLRLLVLSQTEISDSALPILKEFASLKILYLKGSHVTANEAQKQLFAIQIGNLGSSLSLKSEK